MRTCPIVAAFASILLSASASTAQPRPPAPPAGSPAPQPLPAPAAQPPPGPAPAAQPPPGSGVQPLPGPAPQPLPGTVPPGYAPGAVPPGYAPGAVPPGYAPPPYYPYYPPPGQTLGPRTIKWSEGEQIPPGYHKGSQIRKGLVIAGSIMFGVAWVPTAVVGSFSDPYAVVPVFGPFITAGRINTQDAGGIVLFWLVFDGLQQAAGLSMLIAGIAAKEPVLLRNDVQEAKVRILPVPLTFGNRGGGLGLAGTM